LNSGLSSTTDVRATLLAGEGSKSVPMSKLIMDSPPEAAIEATPESTPFVTPVKDESAAAFKYPARPITSANFDSRSAALNRRADFRRRAAEIFNSELPDPKRRRSRTSSWLEFRRRNPSLSDNATGGGAGTSVAGSAHSIGGGLDRDHRHGP